MNTSYKKLREDLEKIGVRAGDVLAVHSSLKSMGQVEGGAECVIAALTDAVGPEGTLIFPAFTFASSYSTSFFSNKDTPSCVGLISETFRKMEGVIRTNHPTHSAALRGKQMHALCEGELLDDTPMGPHSPYQRLPEFGAKILMLGCPFATNSYLHALEEDAGMEYALRGHQEYIIIDENGKEFTRRIRRHNFGRPEGNLYQRYDRALELLDSGDYTLGTIHGAKSVLINSVALKEKSLKKLQEDSMFFVDDPSGLYPNGCKIGVQWVR